MLEFQRVIWISRWPRCINWSGYSAIFKLSQVIFSPKALSTPKLNRRPGKLLVHNLRYSIFTEN